MLKLLEHATRRARSLFAGAQEGEPPEPPDWADDPFSHPALRNMTLAQLADLPFERGLPRQDP